MPKTTVEKARALSVGSMAPSWGLLQAFKERAVFFLSVGSVGQGMSEKTLQQMEALKRENLRLMSQMDHLRDWLLQEDRLEEQIQRIKSVDASSAPEEKKSFLARRHKQMSRILQSQTKAISARVVYREPCSWSSFVWIDVGRANNILFQEEIIAKNSPVVIGTTLVGVVEEVGNSRSKVRLVTDASLAVAVRIARGARQEGILAEKLETVIEMLQARENIFHSKKEEAEFFSILQRLKASLSNSQEERYLAKGELCGSSMPLWRSRGSVLQGTGFNYDFADDEGPARDLRTGEPLFGKKGQKIPLLQESDLLVTSGLDGVFPAGLEVAVVTEVGCLREGECSYQIKAKWLVEDFLDSGSVFVLPPL